MNDDIYASLGSALYMPEGMDMGGGMPSASPMQPETPMMAPQGFESMQATQADPYSMGQPQAMNLGAQLGLPGDNALSAAYGGMDDSSLFADPMAPVRRNAEALDKAGLGNLFADVFQQSPMQMLGAEGFDPLLQDY